MTNNTRGKITSLNGNCYFYVQVKGWLFAAIVGISLCGWSAIGAAQASAVESIITGFVVQKKKTETCQFKIELRFNRFVRILKKLGIDVEGEFTLCANFRWKSEEVKQKLSMFERKLEHQGKMVPVARAELDVLRTMIGE